MHTWKAPRKGAPPRSFIDPLSAPRRRPLLSGPVRDVVGSALAFAAVVVVAAGLYVAGTPHGNGLHSTFSDDPAPSAPTVVGFTDALYFSVNTILTVAYGDYRPVGYGRLLAAGESLSGVIIAGFLISRLVSRQQDRLTKRLVRGVMTAEIREFRAVLAKRSKDFASLAPLASPYPADAARTGLIDRLAGFAKSMARYWRREAEQRDLADVVPLPVATRALGDMHDILVVLQQDLHGQTANSIAEPNRSRVRNITESFLAVGCCLEVAIDDQSVRHSCDRIEHVATAIRHQLDLERL